MATSSRPPTGTNGFRTPRATRRYLANFDAPSFQRATLARWSHRDAPLYYASAALKDGRVFVAGGEYNVVSQVDLLTTQIYHPSRIRGRFCYSASVEQHWRCPSCVLPDGRVLLGDINSKRAAILDPITKTWSGWQQGRQQLRRKLDTPPQSLGPLRGSRQSSQG